MSPNASEARAACILVVVEVPNLRESIADLLQDAGYRVIAVPDGSMAVEFLSRDDPPDAAVVDSLRPAVGDESVAGQLMAGRWPTVPMVILTGADAPPGLERPHRYSLRKPFNVTRLLLLVAEAVKAGRAHPPH